MIIPSWLNFHPVPQLPLLEVRQGQTSLIWDTTCVTCGDCGVIKYCSDSADRHNRLHVGQRPIIPGRLSQCAWCHWIVLVVLLLLLLLLLFQSLWLFMSQLKCYCNNVKRATEWQELHLKYWEYSENAPCHSESAVLWITEWYILTTLWVYERPTLY